ncbi:hypothetical protein AWE51_07435 [Aquimarina aggregata]|uniref:CHRD domain-containing protein n=1 Tax=Aquimarina aggregata TaxID=1642818 RepID=A0A162CQS9_9FLAO|nr:CHRD domain-containing protein [Aquimarina aggregata]KZS40774.1 hypothetical protein AWE51_07435 [Aquimarina aggregata]
MKHKNSYENLFGLLKIRLKLMLMTLFVGLYGMSTYAIQDQQNKVNSNPIVVDNANGGTVAIDIDATGNPNGTTSFNSDIEAVICVDGREDPLVVTHQNPGAENLSYRYVITDAATGLILNVVKSREISLDGAGSGTCQIWGWSYTGVEGNGLNQVGQPLSSLDDLSFSDISDNAITVIREVADGGTVAIDIDATGNPNGTTSFNSDTEAVICVDGREDPLVVTHQNPGAENLSYRYVITDAATGLILNVVKSREISLDGAGSGICQIWGWSYRGVEGNGLNQVGQPLSSLDNLPCSDISDNAITVIREVANGGTVSIDVENTDLANATTTINDQNSSEIIVGDGVANPIIVVHQNLGAENLSYRYVITDAVTGLILNVVNTNQIDLESVAPGTCQIWGWSYRGVEGNGLNQVGQPLSSLDDLPCSDISENTITVVRRASQQPITFEATLTGTQENPAVTTRAFGAAQIILRGDMLEVTGAFTGLEGDLARQLAGGGHIHEAVAGSNGPISNGLFLSIQTDNTNRNGTFNNRYQLSPSQLELLRSRSLYINIHSQANIGGELRGQIVPTSDAVLGANLSGSNEVPSIVTTAGGNIIFDLKGNTLTASGSFSGLAGDIAIDLAGGSHIHDAVVGRNGGISNILNLTIAEDNRSAIIRAEDNIFELTDAQVATLLRQGNYVNVHSQTFRGGELRGQIAPLTNAAFRVQLSGVQEVPEAANTTANGRLLVSYDTSNNQLVVSGSYNGLTGTLATDLAGGIHLHTGVAGTNGPVTIILNTTADDQNNGVFLPENNTFDLNQAGVIVASGETPDSFVNALFERGIYTNIHSSVFRAGELRGQVMPLAQSYFATNLDSRNEIPLAVSDAFGNIQFEVTGNSLIASGSFNNLGFALNVELAGGAHAHLGNANQTGAIQFLLNSTASEDNLSGVFEAANNVVTLTDGQRDALLAGELYINVHSLEIASGELRGQILRDDNRFPATTEISEVNTRRGLIISWDEAIDSDNDLVVYTLQSSLNENFEGLLINEKSAETLFSPEKDQARSLFRTLLKEFIRARVQRRNAILNLRVLSSDGSVSEVGASFTRKIDISLLRSLLFSKFSKTEVEKELAQLEKLENAQNFSVNVSPNPATNGIIRMSTIGALNSNLNITIYDMLGNVVYQNNYDEITSNKTITINSDRLSRGVYIIRMADDSGSYSTTERVVIQ